MNIEKDSFPYSFNLKACEECEANCCSGESGYIYFTKNEGEEIAEFLEISLDEFLKNYTHRVNNRYSIKEYKANGVYNCIFLNGNRCEIYSVRPKQCRTFPFWDYYKNRVDELKVECIGVEELPK